MSTSTIGPVGEREDHTPESIQAAIRPTLDAFAAQIELLCRRAADDVYERLLDTVQDYLRDNGEWNIGEDIRRCREVERENIRLREERDALLNAAMALDAFWLKDWEPPHVYHDQQEERLLSKETLSIWRNIRAAIARATPPTPGSTSAAANPATDREDCPSAPIGGGERHPS